MADTIQQLQTSQHLPLLLKPAPKGSQQQKKKQEQEIAWDFDSKEHAREKYGNFNTPIIIKLASRFNKAIRTGAPAFEPTSQVQSHQEQVDAQELAELVCKALN